MCQHVARLWVAECDWGILDKELIGDWHGMYDETKDD